MHKIALLLGIFSMSASFVRAQEKFEVRDGDRIALVGDTLIEREQESGWLETEMAADLADRQFIVRNLGWSADTPAGLSRASFDFADPKKAFDLLTTQIAQVKPTVVVLGYGMACSFGGQAGLAQFRENFNRLIDTVQANGSNQVRFVIISPIRHQKLPSPMPDPAAHNAQLVLYTDALREIASQRGIPFIDLFDWNSSLPVKELTDDGIHLMPDGYHCMAEEIARQSGWPELLTKARKATVEELRQIVIRKDQLFFDRWRPQNETYLFGFRKHEQGQNAREIPQFDPLVQGLDDRIAQLQELLRLGVKTKVPPASPPRAIHPLLSQPLPDFTVAPGFEVNLWAEDPLLAKPIQMNFDPQGRLWVATSEVYPQIEPGQTANDKIIVLEDTKGLGHADKSTIFVDGLFIPQGVEPGDGGCYVGQSTELLHFDGVPGQRKPPAKRVVLSGFGTEDTHHMVHTLKWGPDGMLYFDQSIYIHSHIETPNGVVRLNSGGVFHLRPDSMQLDVFVRGFCNPWGHQFDQFGQSFITDGAGSQGLTWAVRDATYFTYAEMRRELPSVSPGSYPKFCGLERVASQQFPPNWQDDFITSDFRAHRVVRFSITEDSAGYVTKEMPDVLTSTNVTFRPIDAKFGPDGALYIADWANPIINHGEVDFRDPRRDHEHGRIWRITAKGRPLLTRQNLTAMGTTALFHELLSSNLFNVEQSRRVLTERGKKIEGALRKWTERQTNAGAQLQALWMYQSIGARNDPLLDKVLRASDGRIRAAAVRVLSFWPRTHPTDSGPEPDDCYERALQDPFPRVRVEALRAIALIPSLKSAALALDTLNRPADPFVDYALWLTINDLARPWLGGLQSGAWRIEGHEKELEYALNAIQPELVNAALDEVLKKQPLKRNGEGPWIELIGRTGSQDDIDMLCHKMLANGFDGAATTRAARALNQAAASRGVKPKSDREKIVDLFQSPDEATRIEVMRLAGNWGGPGDSLAQLSDVAKSSDTPQAVRDAAFGAMRKIGGPKTIEKLRPLSSQDESLVIRQPAVLALAALDPAHCGSNAVSLLSVLTNQDAALPVWRSLLGDAGSGPSLAAALPRSGFPADSGRAGLRAVRESGLNEPELIVALARAAGLQGKETALTAAEVKKLGENALKFGDPARGERIFRRQQQSCTSCHSIGGVGGKVGPDLTPVGASSPIDYLIDSVLYPNKEIKDGYQATIIETTDGEEMSGIPVRENATELVMRSASDQEITLPKTQIKTRKPGGSLMPSGLADNLNLQEQLDLYRFLSELGKPGPFDASRGNVARLWMATADPSDVVAEKQIIDSALGGVRWRRGAALVSGSALIGDLEKAALPPNHPAGVDLLAGTRFRSVKSGPIKLNLEAPLSSTVWVDGKPIQRAGLLSVDLPAGVHVLIVSLHNPGADIRLQSDEVTFLTN